MKSRDFVEFYLYARHLHDEAVGNALMECGRYLAGWFSGIHASLHRRSAGIAPVPAR